MSALKETYDRFVATPSVDDLHEEATLNYISSGTNVAGANEIVKYLLTVRHDVQITETVLAWQAGYSSLTVEVAADCKFKNGPSWIVPGVEANLLDGTHVKLPLVKTIVFNGGRIRSVRIYWDQATVLKQLEIVGARGRGWPITDGSHQIDLITKTIVPEDEEPVQKAEIPSEPVALPTPIMSPPTPVATVPSPAKPKGQSVQTPRRTYSITGDIDIPPPPSSARLPRAGWQNHRQTMLLTEEGDLPLKEHSPVRLPRVGQAPKREFSFSNLAEVYKAQEPASAPAPAPVRKPSTHFEYDEEEEEVVQLKPIPFKKTSHAVQHVDLFSESLADDNTPKATKTNQHYKARGSHQEIIFHDSDTTPTGKPKPSIGGGTGGRIPEETVFIQAEEDPNFVQPKKSPITRRDQQTHFSFAEEDPSTPKQPRPTSVQHFSIEGTPDPMEAEYRARALQRREVNHFRPDNVPHFDFVDNPEGTPVPKKENSEGMNKLLRGIGKSWMMGVDSPTVQRDGQRRQFPNHDLASHFSFGQNGGGESEEEKENGRSKQTKRMTMPAIRAEEKEWWEM